MDFDGKNAVAIERIRTELKGKIELVQFPATVLRDLRKLAGAVIQEQSEKSPMARKCTPPSRSSRRCSVAGITSRRVRITSS